MSDRIPVSVLAATGSVGQRDPEVLAAFEGAQVIEKPGRARRKGSCVLVPPPLPVMPTGKSRIPGLLDKPGQPVRMSDQGAEHGR